MAKLTVKQLKEMIREAVKSHLKEQISGLPVAGTQRKTPAPAKRGQQEGNPWLTSGFSLDQLVDAMKKEQDPNQKNLIKQAVTTKLKSAGW